MNWGWKISVFLSIYMIALISVVIFSMNQDVNLVSDDYYKQEIAYEDQITRLKNTRTLDQKPELQYNKKEQLALISFPLSLQPENGTIHLFRPSDFTQDKKIKLNLDNNHNQHIDVSGLIKGLWKIQISWNDKQRSYYQEFSLVK